MSLDDLRLPPPFTAGCTTNKKHYLKIKTLKVKVAKKKTNHRKKQIRRLVPKLTVNDNKQQTFAFVFAYYETKPRANSEKLTINYCDSCFWATSDLVVMKTSLEINLESQTFCFVLLSIIILTRLSH